MSDLRDEFPHRDADVCDHAATYVEDGLIQCYMCVAVFRTDAEMIASRYENVDRSIARTAQGIEAATAAETVERGSVHESPVGKADAPKDSHPDKPGVGG